MLTNNWRTEITYMFCGDVSDRASKSTAGKYIGAFNRLHNKRIKIGTGTTPPKVTDYKLESEIDASKDQAPLSHINSTSNDEEASTQSINCTVTNVSDEPLTVSEIGLENWYADDTNYAFLLAREVFDTPITISPGGGTGFQLKTLLTSLFQRGGAVYAY